MREKSGFLRETLQWEQLNEYVARQQCRQLLLNDYENCLPVDNKPDPREKNTEMDGTIMSQPQIHYLETDKGKVTLPCNISVLLKR